MTQTLRQRIEQARGARTTVSPDAANAFWIEDEPTGDGGVVRVATLLLSVSECPWRCAMCDLWRHTLPHPTPPGSIPRQVEAALDALPSDVRWIKLYNSGNFFDAKSIPLADHCRIADLCHRFERIIVENHPRLCTERVLRFSDRIDAQLEIALGVETLQPGMLRRLNKGMSRDHIDRAIAYLRQHGIDVRSFLLLRPPWTHDQEAVRWSLLTLRHLFHQGVRHASLIPVRAGNGWMDRLRDKGEFAPPSIGAVETAMDLAFKLEPRGVVTMDLWDWPPEQSCGDCQAARYKRLSTMNLSQRNLPAVACPRCDQ